MKKIICFGDVFAQRVSKSVRAWFGVLFVLVMSVCPLSGAFAAESGGSAYLGGNEDFMCGALPGPGFYSIVYAFHYTADESMDGNGHKKAGDFDLDVTGAAFRFIYVSDMKLFGADVGWHAIILFLILRLILSRQVFMTTQQGLVILKFPQSPWAGIRAKIFTLSAPWTFGCLWESTMLMTRQAPAVTTGQWHRLRWGHTSVTRDLSFRQNCSI
jgi:hypothetical protein